MLPSTPLLITPVILSEAYRDTTPELLGLVHETLSFIAQKSPDKIALVSGTSQGTCTLRYASEEIPTKALTAYDGVINSCRLQLSVEQRHFNSTASRKVCA
jgi:hypothetical protein